MTMKLKITNEEKPAPQGSGYVATVLDSVDPGKVIEILPGETKEFFIYKGRTLTVDEK